MTIKDDGKDSDWMKKVSEHETLRSGGAQQV
jgi:hypothetical protein